MRPWRSARALLEPTHQTAYVEYDRLVKKDKDALKSARLDKILGAIQNNLEQIPELKDRLERTREGVEVSSLPDRNMFEIFSQGLFEGVKPMMIIRDHLIRHPDRCTHQAICVPICPTGAWLSTPPYKFDPSRCLESCRLCLDACPSQAIYRGVQEGGEAAGAAAEEIVQAVESHLASAKIVFPLLPNNLFPRSV